MRLGRVPDPIRPLAGPLIALAVVGAVEALAWTPFRVPNAPAFLLIAVVFSAFVSGLWPGLLTAAFAWAYFAYFFSVHGQSGQLFQYSVDDFRRVVIWAFATPATALMVGILKGRVEHLTGEQARLAGLREGEARSKAVLDSAMDPVVTMNHKGDIIEFNPAAERAFGYAKAQVVGKSMAEAIIPPSLREKHRDGLARYLATGEGPVLGRHIEMVAMRADGSEFPVELSILRIPGEGPPTFTGFIRDLTARKRMEEALLRSEKMAAVGELASQVAHEINNPLTVAMGYLERIQARSAGDPKLAEAVERVGRAALRIRDLARGLLSLARTSRMEMSPVQLEQVLDEVRNSLAVDHEKHQIKVDWRVPSGLPVLRGSPDHLHQVFTNLFLNARQAMPRGGTLTVAASVSSGEVRVSVADTGVGIPPENIPRVFEPFFTTKPKGEGSGLGLAICRSIVSGHGGRIDVRSEPGKGATFLVALPTASNGSPS